MLNLSDKLDGLKVPRSADCRTNNGGQVHVNYTLDFTGLVLRDVLVKAGGGYNISGQAQWGKMTAEEIKEKVDGQVLLASTIGQKVESESEILAKGKALFDSKDEDGKREYIRHLQGLVEGS
jgi:hypothetical protein